MKKRLAIEAIVRKHVAEKDLLHDLIDDKDDEWLIVKEEHLEQLTHLFDFSAIETYTLIELNDPELTDLFPDYGFITEQGRTYLYEETVIAFSVISGDPTEITMALLQYEEYLIAKEGHGKGTIYFMDKNYEDLIKKVASAYDINIHIFDLDK
jgi:hypothetical protein